MAECLSVYTIRSQKIGVRLIAIIFHSKGLEFWWSLIPMGKCTEKLNEWPLKFIAWMCPCSTPLGLKNAKKE